MSCGFLYCKNTTRHKKKQGVTFHAFPTDEIEKQKWIQVLRKHRRDPNWTCNDFTRICSAHFKPEDMYFTEKGFKRIYRGAVPAYRVQVPKKSSSPNPESQLQEDEDPPSDQPTEDSPEIEFLKKKIEKLTEDNQTLRYDNKYLKRKIARLTNRTETLKKTVRKLNNCKTKGYEFIDNPDEEDDSEPPSPAPSSFLEVVLS